ncbi:unnamed protein product [Pedinophyceae sp. YPF-701]|nr:unnamed protein product [Pedinophyceae sp. YPF-701]
MQAPAVARHGLAAATTTTQAQEVIGALALDAGSAAALQGALKPLFTLYILFFIARIVMTWDPKIDGRAGLWRIAYVPTEPILGPTRKVLPPLSGVDISPIVWVALVSFINEITCGPQGILSIIQVQGGT